MSLNTTIWFQKHLKWTLFQYHFPWLLLKSLFWFALESRHGSMVGQGHLFKTVSFKRLPLMTRQLAELHRIWRTRGRTLRENTSMASPQSVHQFSHTVLSDSLWPHELQHTRLPCLSPTPGAYSKLMSIMSVIPSNHLILCHSLFLLFQSFPASGSFPVNQFFESGGQSIGVSVPVSVFPMNIRIDFL